VGPKTSECVCDTLKERRLTEAQVAENKQQAELYKGIASENKIPIYESFQDASKALIKPK
jgi:hypothetical protein